MKTISRVLACLLVLVMTLSMIAMTAMAADTITGTSGSITIHKYEYNGTPGNAAPGNTVTPPDGATALKDVTFEVYELVNAADLKAYYDGTADAGDEDTITQIMANWATVRGNYVTESNGTYTVKNYKGAAAAKAGTQTTGADGVATFANLPLGLYVVIETAAPDKVVTTVDPFLVSLPMTVANEWLYDVHVYPKNSTSEGSVTLTKTDAAGAALADVTFKLEKKDGNAWTQQGDQQTTLTNGTLVWSELAHGEYRITEISAPKGYIVDPTPIVFTVNTDNTISCTDARTLLTKTGNGTAALTLTLKNEMPTFNKEITEGENISGVGDTISYQLTMTVPQNITQMATYKVTDAPVGLSVDTDTIQVLDGSANVAASAYSVTAQGDGGFVINFTTANMASYVGKTLTVTYDATVLASAVTNENKVENTATLTYSDKLGADNTSTNDIPDEDTVSNLFTANITKKLDSNTGSAGAGVVFRLYDSSAANTALTFTGTAGAYTLDPTGTVSDLVTDANGKLVISGLAGKTYYLQETETVDGYNLLSGTVELDVGSETDYVYEQTIVNKKGFALPVTGSIGTLMFILGGGALMAGGICLVSSTSKKRTF